MHEHAPRGLRAEPRNIDAERRAVGAASRQWEAGELAAARRDRRAKTLLRSLEIRSEVAARAAHGGRSRMEMDRVCYSGLMSAVFTTRAHFAISSRRNFANSAGPCPAGSNPSPAKRSRTSGTRMILTTSPLSAARIFLGVPAGANNPYQLAASYPGRPDSLSVGTSGSAELRCKVETASAFMRPLLICASAAGTDEKIMLTSPPINPITDGALPLYGTWIIWMPVMTCSSSISRCVMLPTPPEP